MTAGCIVLTYNLKGVTGLKLSRHAYAGIFLGKVKKWNDPLIAKDNAGVALPDQPINVVVRADGSGTTFVFTKHPSAISPEFSQNPGVNTLPNWPTGTRSKGNEGVTASVMMTPGAIGYIEYGYAKSQNLPMAILENKSGSFVAPSTASAQAALATAQFPENLIAWVPDPDMLTGWRWLPHRCRKTCAFMFPTPRRPRRTPLPRSPGFFSARTMVTPPKPRCFATFLPGAWARGNTPLRISAISRCLRISWKRPRPRCKPSHPDFRCRRPEGAHVPNGEEGKKLIPVSEDKKSI
jgi:ABC-type phosphate transport system substrate-binding protein